MGPGFAFLMQYLDAMASSIQSAPHCEHTVAGTFLTTTTPNPKSVAKIVFPVFLN